MFARLVGIALGAALALGATMVVNPDGKVANAVESVTESSQQDAAKR